MREETNSATHTTSGPPGLIGQVIRATDKPVPPNCGEGKTAKWTGTEWECVPRATDVTTTTSTTKKRLTTTSTTKKRLTE